MKGKTALGRRLDMIRLAGVAIAVATVLAGLGFIAAGYLAVGAFFAILGAANGSLTGYRIWRDLHPKHTAASTWRNAVLGWTGVTVAIFGISIAAIVAATGPLRFYGALGVFAGILSGLIAFRGWAGMGREPGPDAPSGEKTGPL